jgi:hypothetical protein
MRTQAVSQIDNLLEHYLRDQLSLDLHSSAGRVDEPISSWSSGDDKLIRYLEVGERWAWLFRYCEQTDVALLINEALAKAFRRKRSHVTTRHGSLDVDAEGSLERMSERELAESAGLSIYQYRRRLTRARVALGHALQDRVGQQGQRAA